MTSAPSKTSRLAIVLSHPTQYYSPWFRWLKENTDLEFRVFYLWEFGVRATFDPKFGETFKWDVDLLSGYESEFVPNLASNPGTHRFFGLRNPSLISRLDDWRADTVLLFGYRYWTHLTLIGRAHLRGLRMIFRGDSHRMGRPKPSAVSSAALGFLYRQFQAFLYTGAANREYFAAYGVASERLFFSPHSVNDQHFHPSESERKAAGELRESLGLKGKKVFLFAGKFVPEKQPVELLSAFIEGNWPDTALVFVGQGALRSDLEGRASANPAACVRFLPFANQSEMPLRYLLADVFVLPSKGLYETWGLAVNEAMHMGVPCLVSTRVGCQRDLVTEGETGWTFDPDEPGALQQAMDRSLKDLQSATRLASVLEAVAARIADYTYARSTRGLQEALVGLGQ